jgi:two-component system sensor kinase FixL
VKRRTVQSPIGFVVDAELRVVEFIGHTSPLIRLSPGAATLDLGRLLTDSLRPAVLEAVEQARERQRAVQLRGVTYYELGVRRTAELRVTPEPGGRWRIEMQVQARPGKAAAAAHSGSTAEELAVELDATNEELRATVDELVNANREIRRAQAALEKSQNELRERYRFIAAVLDTVGALILVLDPGGRIVELNRACGVVGGPSQGGAGDLLFWDFIPPEQLVEWKGIFAQLLEETPTNTHESDWLVRGGDRRRIAWSNTTMRQPDGVRYVIATGIEVTSRYLAEQSLHASEAKFRAVIENAAEAILGVDPAGQIVIANPAAALLFGYTLEELLSWELTRLLPERFRAAHPDHLQSYFAQPVPRKAFSGSFFVGRRQDGSEVPLEISLSTINTAEGEVAVAYILDITERIQHRQHLQSLAGKLLKAQEEERRRIARDIHDHLTQIISLLGMKLGFLVQDVEGNREALRAGLEEARHQVDLIHDEVRDVSHRLHPSTLEYSGLVPALESLVHETEKLDKPRVHLVIGQLPDSIPQSMATALYRIAQEALHNALKSAAAENVSVHVNLQDGHVHLVVIDDGCGFVVEEARRAGGLGLLSMEERARDLGGTFAIQSARGSGTRVAVTAPLAAT